MYHTIVTLSTVLLAPLAALHAAAPESASKPNVLLIIADDASQHFGAAYGCQWVKTPNIDRLAKQGLVFQNGYTPTAKCAPSRSAILTGRNPWQLETENLALVRCVLPPVLATCSFAEYTGGDV